jgi:hypothetical protein
MPEDELKSAFINLCLPDWQQEFLKTGINEYSSTWVEIFIYKPDYVIVTWFGQIFDIAM